MGHILFEAAALLGLKGCFLVLDIYTVMTRLNLFTHMCWGFTFIFTFERYIVNSAIF